MLGCLCPEANHMITRKGIPPSTDLVNRIRNIKHSGKLGCPLEDEVFQKVGTSSRGIGFFTRTGSHQGLDHDALPVVLDQDHFQTIDLDNFWMKSHIAHYTSFSAKGYPNLEYHLSKLKIPAAEAF